MKHNKDGLLALMSIAMATPLHSRDRSTKPYILDCYGHPEPDDQKRWRRLHEKHGMKLPRSMR